MKQSRLGNARPGGRADHPFSGGLFLWLLVLGCWLWMHSLALEQDVRDRARAGYYVGESFYAVMGERP